MQLTPLQAARPPYQGTTRKLVIAFDVGTTFSGASFSKLEPGATPVIQGVTRFPGQEGVGGNSKIPSIIYYDGGGNVRAVGAEALDCGFQGEAEENGYTKVEWFKLHLRPKALSAEHVSDKDIPALPRNKRPVDVLADYLRYLFQCTKQYILEMSYNGDSYWRSVEDSIDFVLSHPNGWEGRQQGVMREAAVMAGLVPQAEAQSRVQFVTEGEASLHFCVMQGTLSDDDTQDQGTIVVDAGGGTVDLSAYRKTDKGYEEVASTQCRLQGSIFVSRRARDYLTGRLRGSRFGTDADVNTITEVFDATTKMCFRDSNSPYFIKFGTARDRDPKLDIRNGQMKIAGNIVAEFFTPSIDAIIDAVAIQLGEAAIRLSTVCLVGGFAASPWLFSKLQERMTARGLSVCRPDGHVNKAVADGAVSYYLDHFVSARVSRFSYGTECATIYRPFLASHIKRESTTRISASGMKIVPGVYDEILPKGAVVKEETEFSETYAKEVSSLLALRFHDSEVLCYRGQRAPPRWIDEDKDSFKTMCTLNVDFSNLKSDLKPQVSSTGQRYFEFSFEMVLLFGLTELKALARWQEGGEERRCPAVIVYEPDE